MSTAQRLWNTLHRGAGALGFGVASYRPSVRRQDFAAALRVKAERDMLTTPLEGAQIMAAVRATAKLGGDMAEVGVYQGATARLIRLADPSRPLHLFDTFAGLPETRPDDLKHGGRFQTGEFAAGLEDVRAYLQDASGVVFYPGLFPNTAGPVTDRRFSFVHLDVDIYESSRACVAWFYERMLPGGILLSHDFATCAGPRRALTEFFADRPEPLIELPGDQAMIVKL